MDASDAWGWLVAFLLALFVVVWVDGLRRVLRVPVHARRGR